MSAEAVRLSQLKCGPGEALWAPMGVGSPEDDRGTGRARIPVDTMRARGISLGDPVLLEVCPTGPRPKATSRGGGAAEGAEAEGGASKGEEGAAEGGDGEPPAVGCGCGGVGECTGLLFLCVAWPWPAAYSGSGHIQFDDLVQLPRRAAVDNYPPLVKRVGGQRIVRDLHTGVITSFTRPLVKAERIEVVFTSESNQVPAPLLKVMLQHRPLHSGCLVQFVNESISFTVQTTAPSQMCVVVTASTT
ncbi:hypothetical protein Pelo_11303 [Pelomyxa schiedti]|nr:hypothetical protein Pelo_11303 [Pelomyxa schiedti]